MENISAMLIVDLVVIIAGIYFLYLSFKMKKNKKVESFVIAEEALKLCKDQEAFASYLSIRQMIFSIIMVLAGILMVIHETVLSFGYWYYLIVAVLSLAFIVFYKQLTDGRIKYC